MDHADRAGRHLRRRSRSTGCRQRQRWGPRSACSCSPTWSIRARRCRVCRRRAPITIAALYVLAGAATVTGALSPMIDRVLEGSDGAPRRTVRRRSRVPARPAVGRHRHAVGGAAEHAAGGARRTAGGHVVSPCGRVGVAVPDAAVVRRGVRRRGHGDRHLDQPRRVRSARRAGRRSARHVRDHRGRPAGRGGRHRRARAHGPAVCCAAATASDRAAGVATEPYTIALHVDADGPLVGPDGRCRRPAAPARRLSRRRRTRRHRGPGATWHDAQCR